MPKRVAKDSVALSFEGQERGSRAGQFSSVAQWCQTLQPHGLQHNRLPCPSPTPRAYSNSWPLSQWCHPTISSFVVLFSSHLQSFLASGSFQMSQFFTSGGQSIGSFSFSISPSNEYSELISFRIDWLNLLAVQNCGVGEDSWKLDRRYNKNPVLKQLWWFSH